MVFYCNIEDHSYHINRCIVENKRYGEYMIKKDEATLSCEKDYTVFRFRNHVIRFKAPYSLERYTEVKEWDHGYLVVMAKYAHNDQEEEEYIDLVPVLKNLYFDFSVFLAPIKKVRIADDEYNKSS